MQKYLEKENEIGFDKIFNQILGYLLFKDFCESMSDEPVPQLKFYEEVNKIYNFVFVKLSTGPLAHQSTRCCLRRRRSWFPYIQQLYLLNRTTLTMTGAALISEGECGLCTR